MLKNGGAFPLQFRRQTRIYSRGGPSLSRLARREGEGVVGGGRQDVCAFNLPSLLMYGPKKLHTGVGVVGWGGGQDGCA